MSIPYGRTPYGEASVILVVLSLIPSPSTSVGKCPLTSFLPSSGLLLISHMMPLMDGKEELYWKTIPP